MEIIEREQVRRKLADGATVVEALPREYYDDAHLPGALNLPHDEVDALAPTLLPDRDAEIVVYCADASCPNSAIAAARLSELGYAKVYAYADGKKDWIEAGLATESADTVRRS